MSRADTRPSIRAGDCGPSGRPCARLLDFGLAQALVSDGGVTRALEGTFAGTAAYVSPEQAPGKGP